MVAGARSTAIGCMMPLAGARLRMLERGDEKLGRLAVQDRHERAGGALLLRAVAARARPRDRGAGLARRDLASALRADPQSPSARRR